MRRSVTLERHLSSNRPMMAAVPAIAAATAFLAAGAASRWPETLYIIGATLVTPKFLRSAKWRAIFAVVGGLFVLQSSSGLSATKVGYLAGLLLATGIAAFRLLRGPRASRVTVLLLVAAAVMASAIAISMLTAGLYGISFAVSFRDAIPYGLLIAFPLLGVDLGRSAGVKWTQGFLIAAALLAAVSFTVDWLNRRGVSELPIARLAFGSAAIISLGFAYGVVKLCYTRHSKLWVMFAALMPTSVLVTGSRTGLAMVAAFLGVVGRREKFRVSIPRIFLFCISLAIILTLLVPIVGSTLISNPTFLHQRLDAAQLVLTGEGDRDQSYEGRQYQTEQAVEALERRPFFGVGLGYQFVKTNSQGAYLSTSIDSPLGPVAKFGLIGTIFLVVYAALFVTALRAAVGRGPSVAKTSFAAFGMIFLVQIPFGSFLEDKGLAMVGLVMVALAVATGPDEGSRAMSARNVSLESVGGGVIRPNTQQEEIHGLS